MNRNCKECINSRLVLSENGWHTICTLSQKDTYDCFVHGSKYYCQVMPKEEDKNEKDTDII